jgi:hypothetical protein
VRLGAFLYSESAQVQADSTANVDLFTRTRQGATGDFSILFGTGALYAALGAVWDSRRDSSGRVGVPDHDNVELLSYSVEFPGHQIRLNVHAGAILGGIPVEFTAHYMDSFPIVPITLGIDAPPDHPYQLLSPHDSPSVDVDPTFYAAVVLFLPGLLNGVVGVLVASQPAPDLPANLAGGLGGAIAQVFLPKIYLQNGSKLVMQYAGVLTGADFGVQAYGTVDVRARTPVVTVTTRLVYGPAHARPVGGIGNGGGGTIGGGGGVPQPPRHASQLVVVATTDDMRNPRLALTAKGLAAVSQDGPTPSADGVYTFQSATFKVTPQIFTTTVMVTATDDDGLTATATATVSLVSIDD